MGSVPALTHSSASIRYFSALGCAEHSTASTLPSVSRTQVSSEEMSSLDAAVDHVAETGSKIAVAVDWIEPTSTRPSGSTQHGASPTSAQPGGAGMSVQWSRVTSLVLVYRHEDVLGASAGASG